MLIKLFKVVPKSIYYPIYMIIRTSQYRYNLFCSITRLEWIFSIHAADMWPWIWKIIWWYSISTNTGTDRKINIWSKKSVILSNFCSTEIVIILKKLSFRYFYLSFRAFVTKDKVEWQINFKLFANKKMLKNCYITGSIYDWQTVLQFFDDIRGSESHLLKE